jgi:hypothetical protein
MGGIRTLDRPVAFIAIRAGDDCGSLQLSDPIVRLSEKSDGCVSLADLWGVFVRQNDSFGDVQRSDREP